MTSPPIYDYANAVIGIKEDGNKCGLYAPPTQSELSQLIASTIRPLGSYIHNWKHAEVSIVPELASYPLVDFPKWVSYVSVPILSERAKEIIAPIIQTEVEWLPLSLPGGQQFFVACFLEPVAAVEIEKCKVARFQNNSIRKIEHYAFILELVRRHTFFKLPREWSGEILFTDEFRRIVEANGLTGLSFDYPVTQIEQV